jgi:hypothetical protein
VFILTALLVICSACQAAVPPITPSLTPIPTNTPTPEPSATATQSPTETQQPPSPTPEAGINMEMFHTIPATYQYLLAHRNEFVQSPDPVTDRASFDEWFVKELLPALGPLSERVVNVDGSAGPGYYGFFASVENGTPTTSEPPFFWFESGGVVYGVPCITTEKPSFGSLIGGTITMCPAIFDSSAVMYGTRAFATLSSGQAIQSIEIYYDPEGLRSDLDWGIAQELATAVGDYTLGMGNEKALNELGIGFQGVKFGFGSITLRPPVSTNNAQIVKPVFVYPNDGATLDYNGSYLFKVETMPNAHEFLWDFFQNGVMVWENLRDEGTTSGNDYGIHPNTIAHSKFVTGSVEVWVRASINGQWTDATVITIYLR